MLDAMHAFLALGWTGLAIFCAVMLVQIAYHIYDEISALGGLLGVALFFTMWLKIHINSRQPYVGIHEYTEPKHKGKHRCENIVGELKGVHRTWKLKKAEDFDGLFASMVQEKRHEPAPIF